MIKELEDGGVANPNFTIGQWLDGPTGKGRFDVARWLKEMDISRNTEIRWVYGNIDNLCWKWQLAQEFDSVSFKLNRKGHELDLGHQEAYFEDLKYMCSFKEVASLCSGLPSDIYLHEMLRRDFSKAAGLGYLFEAIEATDSKYGKAVKHVAAKRFDSLMENPYRAVHSGVISDIANGGVWDLKGLSFYSTNVEVIKAILAKLKFYITRSLADLAYIINENKGMYPALIGKGIDEYVLCLTTLIDREGYSAEELSDVINKDPEMWYIVRKLNRMQYRKGPYDS